jgi:hypothetical protein
VHFICHGQKLLTPKQTWRSPTVDVLPPFSVAVLVVVGWVVAVLEVERPSANQPMRPG